jgi:acyl-CoA synthetase (AMP-forming)/AMP-acid ligase II
MVEQAPLPYLPRRLHQVAERWRNERPSAPALIDHDGTPLTFAALGEAVDSAVEVLRRAGVRGGDRVMLINENCSALAALLLACSRLDAWAVLINARIAPPEIRRIADHCTPRALVFTDGCSRDAGRHGADYGASAQDITHCGSVLVAGERNATPEPVDDSNADQVGAMIYTSGTTGTPKGVMLTHRNLLFIASVSGEQRGLSENDHVYAVLPVSHVFGLASTFLGTLTAGGCLELVPRFDPAHLADALERGITVFQGVPAMYAKLLEYLEQQGRDLKAPKLRYMSSGGAPLDIDWKRRIEARFGTALNNGYGLTEASPTVSQTLIHARRDDDSIGPPLPWVEVRFVDPTSGQECAPGTAGELWVRGPNIMKGYYRDKAATDAAVTADGWLKTGDVCRQDPDGALFLVGRCKELIIRSGFNVYPPEVETALNAHPLVTHCAVVGRRVPGNEEVIAFVEIIPGSKVSEDDLKNFVHDRLAPYKRPQRIFIVTAMPASATGKIQKHHLVATAERLCRGEDDEIEQGDL